MPLVDSTIPANGLSEFVSVLAAFGTARVVATSRSEATLATSAPPCGCEYAGYKRPYLPTGVLMKKLIVTALAGLAFSVKTRIVSRFVALAAVLIAVLMFSACAGDDGDGVTQEQLVPDGFNRSAARPGVSLARTSAFGVSNASCARKDAARRVQARQRLRRGIPRRPTGAVIHRFTVCRELADRHECMDRGARVGCEPHRRRSGRPSGICSRPPAGWRVLSDDHSSLHRGYWVAYTGVLEHSVAQGRANEAQAAGFPMPMHGL